MSQATVERTEARSIPNAIQYDDAVFPIQTLAESPNPAVQLTRVVPRQGLISTLTKDGFTNPGRFSLYSVVGKPFSWQVYRKTIEAPEFPDREELLHSVIAVSEQSYSQDKKRTALGPDDAFVVGSFSTAEIPDHEFEKDLEVYMNDLVYHPGRSVTEKMEKYAGLIKYWGSIGFSLAALYSQQTSGTNFGVPALFLAVGAFAVGKTIESDSPEHKKKRTAEAMTQTSGASTTFAGPDVPAALTRLRQNSEVALLKRAIFDAVQANLAQVNVTRFDGEFTMPLKDPISDYRRILVSEYESYKSGERAWEDLSPLLLGTIEVNTGKMRVLKDPRLESHPLKYN